MRCLIDTNIFVFLASEADRLKTNVRELLSDYDTQINMSIESVKELIIAFRSKKLLAKKWKSEVEILPSILNEYHISVLPLGHEHLRTFARLRPDSATGHNDPSDLMIISHAITEKIPLISSDSRFPFYRKQGLDLIED